MKKTKQVMALLLALVMVVSMMPSNVQFVAATAAEDKIELGDETWSADGQAYTFSDVTVSFKSDQKIFCISVDNGGYFKLPKKIDLGNMSSSSDRMNGLTKSGEYKSSLSGDEELSSMTVIGSDITDEQIKNFLTQVVFYTGTTDQTVKQTISVVANSCSLPDGNSTAMAIDGKLHFYKYVEFPSGDNTSTWATAYKEAKKSVFEGLKGYLATITSENEEKYLYSSLGCDLQAWIGGARTLLPRDGYDGFVLDSNEITDEALKPLDDSNKIVRKWSWLCGPEAGTTFYETGESGNVYGGSVCDGQYADWNKNEPNNSYSGGGTSAYYQEYALEYGFEKANWNDYHPNNVSRSMWGIKGYIVEYSPYATSGESGKEDVDNKMTTPSTTELVVIQKSKPRLNADNLVLSKEQANKLTEATVKNLANTKGSYNGTTADASSSNITVDSDQLTTVKSAEAGTSNKLTFSYKYDTGAADVVTKDTTVYVADVANTGSTSTNNTTTIGANNVSVTTDDLAACADEDKVAELIRSKAAPVAVKDGKAAVSADITQKSSEVSKASTAGTYKVTYTYNGVDTTINVTITDSNQVAKVTADNFEVVRGSGNLTAADVITKSNAQAKNSSGSVTVTTEDGFTADINVSIRKPVVSMTAEDFMLTKETAAALTGEAAAKDYAKVGVTREGTTVADPFDKITANPDDLAKIVAGNSGTIGFTYRNGKYETGSVTAKATVVDVQYSETKGTDRITIGADNVTLDYKDISSLTEDELKDLIRKNADPAATDNGALADPSDITGPKLVKDGDGYKATFTYKDVPVTTDVVISNVPAQGEVNASDCIFSLDDIGKLTADDVIRAALSKYTDKNGVTDNGEGVVLTQESLDAINRMTEPGTLPLTFTDKSGTIVKKVTATVVQNRRYDTSTGNITLGANDFCITVEQAKTIVLKQDQTDVADMLKKLGNAIATDDGKFIPFKDAAITVDASAIQAAKGSYELVYTYKGKVNKVTVTVKDDGSADTTSSETTVPDVNLTANDFAVAAGTESIDETAFKKLAEVVVKYNDGSSVENVTIDVEDLAVLNKKIRAKSTDSVFVKVYATDKKTGKQLSATVKVTLPKKAATPKPTKKPGTIAKPGRGISADDIAKELGVDKATAEKIKDYAEKNGTSMDTLRITDTAVKKLKDDKDIKGSDFSRLKARANKSSKNSITLKWVKQSGADGYLIYSNQCNQGGKKYRYKLTKTIKGKNKTTWTQKKRKKGKYYKYMVVAYKLFNGHKVTIAAAPTIHSVTKGGKRGMAKAVSIKKLGNKKKRTKITLKARKTAKIKAVEIRADKKKKIMKHRKLAYESSNVKVAKVTGSGKIKAVKKGKCKIWVYAQNGVYKEIKVTVK